jgi:hypothetical protein
MSQSAIQRALHIDHLYTNIVSVKNKPTAHLIDNREKSHPPSKIDKDLTSGSSRRQGSHPYEIYGVSLLHGCSLELSELPLLC